MNKGLSWKALSIANLAVGLFLWFLFSTDYSLMGNVADILFPPLAGILAIFSLAIGITKARNKPQKFLGIFAHVPSIVGGGLFVFMCVVMFIPPFTLGALFVATEISDEVHIQQAVSPDGIRVADVYFRGAGAYSSSSGRVIVRVRHRIVPFLERDILYQNSSFMREEIGDYIEWRDSNTIYITETKREMPVGIVQTEFPIVIAVPYGIFQTLKALVVEANTTERMLLPVRDIPIYSGKVPYDHPEYYKKSGIVFRSLRVANEGADTVAQWYQKILGLSPWNLIQVNRSSKTESGVSDIQYCIQATREFNGALHMYYWEISGTNDISRSVHVQVNFDTPDPYTDICKRYIKTP